MKKLYFIMLFFTFCVFAQIQIDWDEIPHEIGTQITQNSAGNVTVNLGTTGGPQEWNFLQPMGSEEGTAIIIESSSAPFIDSFPGTNLVDYSPSDTGEVYLYHVLDNNFIKTLGMVGIVEGDTFLHKYEPPFLQPLPLKYGDSWRYSWGFQMKEETGTIEYFYFGTKNINAFGTVNIPYGSYECLRVCSYDTIVMKITIPGFSYSDTVTSISYQFLAEDYGTVVSVWSFPEETDPNFTNALTLDRLTSFTGKAEETENLNRIKCLSFPQLFSDYVTIRYSLSEKGYVELTLHDISGRIVKTLVNTPQEKGEYTYKWYGEDSIGNLLPCGIYFYKLKVDNNKIHTGKIVLMR
ncbi:MAG: FlgD immunoglobulin-like domain containing protein [candidate division WOR-3 bacterium]